MGITKSTVTGLATIVLASGIAFSQTPELDALRQNYEEAKKGCETGLQAYSQEKSLEGIRSEKKRAAAREALKKLNEQYCNYAEFFGTVLKEEECLYLLDTYPKNPTKESLEKMAQFYDLLRDDKRNGLLKIIFEKSGYNPFSDPDTMGMLEHYATVYRLNNEAENNFQYVKDYFTNKANIRSMVGTLLFEQQAVIRRKEGVTSLDLSRDDSPLKDESDKLFRLVFIPLRVPEEAYESIKKLSKLDGPLVLGYLAGPLEIKCFVMGEERHTASFPFNYPK